MFIVDTPEITVTIKEFCAKKKISRTTEWRMRKKKKVETIRATPRGKVFIILK